MGCHGHQPLLQALLKALSLVLSPVLAKEHCKHSLLSSMGTSHSFNPNQCCSVTSLRNAIPGSPNLKPPG